MMRLLVLDPGETVAVASDRLAIEGV